MTLPWYLWVFGGVAVVNMLAGLIGLGLFIDWLLSRRKADYEMRELSADNRRLRASAEILEMRLRRANDQIKEISQGSNAFGRILP